MLSEESPKQINLLHRKNILQQMGAGPASSKACLPPE
jgi:hypothetical protein